MEMVVVATINDDDDDDDDYGDDDKPTGRVSRWIRRGPMGSKGMGDRWCHHSPGGKQYRTGQDLLTYLLPASQPGIG